jgi:CIC family chloride channel protein
MDSRLKSQGAFNLWRERRRRLIFRAVILGTIVGVIAVGFQYILFWAESLNHSLAVLSRENGFLTCILFVILCSFIACGASYLTFKIAPEAAGSGIPHAKGVIAGLYQIRAKRIIFTKIVAGAMAIASGMSLGREGPTVQIGAACGKVMCDLLQVSKRSVSLLIAAGSGAGLAAAFNAPLAGFLFVMEELKREMSSATYATALLTSICAVAVSRLINGQSPSFILSDPGSIPLSATGVVAVLGIAGGIVGVIFNKLILGLINARIKFSIPIYYIAGTVGFVSGILLLFLPEITGGGHFLTQNLLAGHDYKISGGPASFGLMSAKLLFTVFCFISGVPGGIFMPLLVIGSLLGNSIGVLCQPLFPEINNLASIFSMLGMGAVLTGSVRTPLTGCVLIIEMTGEYSLLYPLMVGAFSAYIIAEYLKDTPIYDALLEMDLYKGQSIASHGDEVVTLEFTVEPHSELDKRRLNEIELPGNSLIISVERAGKSFLPRGSSSLAAGDVLTIALEGVKKRENILTFKRMTESKA